MDVMATKQSACDVFCISAPAISCTVLHHSPGLPIQAGDRSDYGGVDGVRLNVSTLDIAFGSGSGVLVDLQQITEFDLTLRDSSGR